MNVEIGLTPKQHAAYQLLFDHKTEHLLFGGGANGGKSWLGAFWLVSMCYNYPGTKYFIGREELKRLRQSTLITFFKVLRAYGCKDDFTYNGQDHFLLHRNGSRIDLLELKNTPSDPLYERYGSLEYTSGWIEESAETAFDAFDTLKTRVGRWRNDECGILGKLYLTCNPKRNWLYWYFYKPWREGRLPENRAFIQALVHDNVFRESGAVEKLEQLDNRTQRARLLEGVWEYEDEPDQLIQFEWLEAARKVSREDGIKFMGVDVARYGDDLSAIAIMKGNTLYSLKSKSSMATDKVADWVSVEIANEKVGSENLGVDGVGLGAGTVDMLRRMLYKPKDIQSGSTKYPPLPVLHRYKFKNLRALMWWLLKEDLREGKVRIDLPDDTCTGLFEDLASVHYKIEADRTIKIEPKEDIKGRLGRSTDKGDAFVYANYMRHLRSRRSERLLTPNDVGVYLP